MNHGLPPRSLATLYRILAAHPEVETAILYGSRALGRHRPGSDIDLALVGNGVDDRLCGRIWSEFDASDLPYKVDVTALAQAGNVALAEHIERVGVPLYRRGDRVAA